MTENASSSTDNGEGKPRHYTLVCSLCGKRQDDDGFILDCTEDHAPALLRTDYAEHRFMPWADEQGLFRYRKWLPVVRTHVNVGRTAVYRSAGLAKALGLSNLWIAFNGYWPERGATLQTATFKEFEAYTVLGRVPEGETVLTVASSGNTAAAFAWACSQARVPCLLVVPGSGLSRLRFRAPLDPCVHLIVIEDGDYPDAIDLAARVVKLSPLTAEGGIRNVGRRDGLATVLLSAFEEMQCLPSHYFHAAGSATGAIAVLEAAIRVCRASGETTLPRLVLCQNEPFTPIHEAWRANPLSRGGGGRPRAYFRDVIKDVCASELTNWAPPYEVHGGIYDSLVASGGDVLTASNASVQAASGMFSALEGIDIEPAAAVAVACLRKAVADGKVNRDSVVLLNITGGGRLRLARDYQLIPAEAQLRLTRNALAEAAAMRDAAALCATTALSRA